MKSKISSLTKSEDFKNLLNGRKISNRFSTIFFRKLSTNNSKLLKVSFVTKKKIGNAVRRNKIKRIDTKGKKFDPNLHQAMSEIEDEKVEAGTIVQEIQAGYMLGERLLRPSLVAIAKKNNSKNQENIEKKT